MNCLVYTLQTNIRNMKKLVSTLMLVFSISAFVFPQSKYDKMIAAAEVSYEAGNYKKAMSSLEKFKKKAFKKLGQQNEYTPTYHFLAAKYNLATGHIQEFEIRCGLPFYQAPPSTKKAVKGMDC
jgi:hypothetical protein